MPSIPHNQTFDNGELLTSVLAELRARSLGVEKTGASWKMNSPFRADSDSGDFRLWPEGNWLDGPRGNTGNLRELAEFLGVNVNGHIAKTTDSKREYANLAEYAKIHGAPVQAFANAGWSQEMKFGRPALKFMTECGPRWRFIDEEGGYIHDKGYKPCWYGLKRASTIAHSTPSPLFICNGEASTVVAQWYGLAACCVTSGEKPKLPDHLIDELKRIEYNKIYIVFDCDVAGRKAASSLENQLQRKRFDATALDLGGSDGFDLADFCKLHGDDSLDAYQELKIVGPPKPFPYPDDWGKTPEPDESYLTKLSRFDDGTAECVKIRHANQFIHCDSLGWLTWTGKYWDTSKAEPTLDAAIIDTMRARTNAAYLMDSPDTDLIGECLPKDRIIAAVKRRLKPKVSVVMAELDVHPDKINCANGVIDLRTKTLLPHNPELYFTYCLDTDYVPSADYSAWRQFMIDNITPDDVDLTPDDLKKYGELYDWLQMALGYSITGHVEEDCLFYVYGPGGSGKGTMAHSYQLLLGNMLCKSTKFSTFTKQRQSNDQGFDLAPLKTARMVLASETQRRMRLQSELVKSLTGRDWISCSFKGKDHFEYQPRYKIWLSANPMVNADPDDSALWQRLYVVHFPNERRGTNKDDKSLARRLNSKAGLEAILAWTVEGAYRWYQAFETGAALRPPELVAKVTAEHRDENDEVKMFLDECCEIADDESFAIPVPTLLNRYTIWCEENGFTPKKNRSFNEAMRSKKFVQKPVWHEQKTRKCWVCIKFM